MNKVPIVLSALFGAVLGGGVAWWWGADKQHLDSRDEDDAKPLYWVAPMDPNYRRDQPGKSPMGMDLIPVYADDAAGPDVGPGAITISPEVVNNLGVRTAVAEEGTLLTEINTVGYVQYNQDKLIHIHPRVQGWVETLYVKAEGDPVEKGQPLYELYAPALVNAQEEYLLALERRNDRLVQAAQDRLHALQVPDEAINRLRKTRQVTQTITFSSPQSGVVDNLNIREGFYIQPGTNVMSIGALDEVWVEAEVFERQASWVQPGAAVTMMLDYLPGQRWEGAVDYVYPTLDEETRTVKLRMRFANHSGVLKPNMFAQVVIHARSERSALLVPREAVIRSGKADRVVLALGDGRYKSIEVTVGRMSDQRVEVLSGLVAGDAVVTSAQFLLDSESSKTSDFQRMHHASQDAPDTEAEVQGVIRHIDHERRELNVDREAIPKWNRGPVNMDFMVDDALDLHALQAGMAIHFTFEITEQRSFRITQIHVLPEAGAEQGDHGGMSHD